MAELSQLTPGEGKVVSVAEGAFVCFGQLERLTFYGLGELCMSKWAIHRG